MIAVSTAFRVPSSGDGNFESVFFYDGRRGRGREGACWVRGRGSVGVCGFEGGLGGERELEREEEGFRGV